MTTKVDQMTWYAPHICNYVLRIELWCHWRTMVNIWHGMGRPKSENDVLACLMSYIVVNSDTSCMKLLQYMHMTLACTMHACVDMRYMQKIQLAHSTNIWHETGNACISMNNDTTCMRLILDMYVYTYYILDMHHGMLSTKLTTCYSHDCRPNWTRRYTLKTRLIALWFGLYTYHVYILQWSIYQYDSINIDKVGYIVRISDMVSCPNVRIISDTSG